MTAEDKEKTKRTTKPSKKEVMPSELEGTNIYPLIETLQQKVRELESKVITLQKSDLAKNQIMPRITAHLDQLTFKLERLDDSQVKMGVDQHKTIQFIQSIKAELDQLKKLTEE